MYKSINSKVNKAAAMYEKIKSEYCGLEKGPLLFEKARLEIELECRKNWTAPILEYAAFGISALALLVSVISCLDDKMVLVSVQTVTTVSIILAVIVGLIAVYHSLNRTDTQCELAVRLSCINELLEEHAIHKKAVDIKESCSDNDPALAARKEGFQNKDIESE